MANLGRHAPKSRAGCLTCKKRRVKCDQARPTCQRCIKAGLGCGGYPLELISSTLAQISRSTVISTSTTLLSAFSATRQEWQAYGLYSRKVSSALSGAFDTDLWQSLFLQIATTEVPVRLALFALGTLVRHNESGSVQHISSCLCTHCRQGLRYYNKSILSLSDYLQKTPANESIDLALVSCVLFTCIELYRTNDRNAITLVEKGSSILSQATELNFHHRQPHPSLLNLFNRLRISTGMFSWDFNGRPSIDALAVASEQLRFENLGVAREILLKLTPKAQSLRVAASKAHRLDTHRSDLALSLRALTNEQDIAKTQLASWFRAFEGLKLHPGQDVSPFAVQFLYAKFLSTRIHINTALEISQDIYLDYIDDFKAIVAAAEEGVQHASNDETWLGFTFEGGFLPSLYLAGLKCRDPEIRRKILSLMHRCNAKEGLWCRSELVCVLARVMEIEEGCTSVFSGDRDSSDSGQAPPRLYDVSCDINYRKLGSLFVDVVYTLYDEASPEPWRTFTETLLIEK
ncbi:uncharacterized protein A1O9_06007 [Exophiala aquamarina CBS 119918]|uniref:Zn(2)-C6 fungal-type domain-containing protein n=1 Tax=Exophiala aquamarina CBS 119918 TaxID=1182545 RepID=A0A072PD97_9EURO|nr:uncharacterized protein A1O9_06007 [Exophiala aquamarina CBS 119918]KEF58084.1 hypothetical protein A1O9_06007 [Exophiala aquamarina CBS 119918]